MPLIMQWDENFDIGADTGTPVDDKDYQVPFRFTGKLNKLTLNIDRPKLSPADVEEAEAGSTEQQGERVALARSAGSPAAAAHADLAGAGVAQRSHATTCGGRGSAMGFSATAGGHRVARGWL